MERSEYCAVRKQTLWGVSTKSSPKDSDAGSDRGQSKEPVFSASAAQLLVVLRQKPGYSGERNSWSEKKGANDRAKIMVGGEKKLELLSRKVNGGSYSPSSCKRKPSFGDVVAGTKTRAAIKGGTKGTATISHCRGNLLDRTQNLFKVAPVLSTA